MKIGVVTEYYYPYLGGIAEHVHNTWRQFRALGHEAVIITPHMRGLRFGADSPGCAGWASEPDVIRVGESRPFYFNDGFVRFTSPLGLSRRLREVFASERFDLLHVHSPLVPTLPMAAVKAADCPVVGTFHTQIPNTAAYTFLRHWFKGFADRLDGCIAISPLAAEAVERHFGLDCTIIPNGVDVDLLNPKNPPAPEFADGRKKNVLFVGRFDPHNGLKVLLDAFPSVKRRIPEARLIIVGDGPLRSSHEKVVAAEVAGAVHFAGMQYARKAEFYACADVVVNPALYHAQSIVCLEAMASGSAIVASDIPGFKWLMEEDAVYARPGDPRSLAAAIVAVLENKALRERLGRRARRRAEGFSWVTISRSILKHHASVLARSVSGSSGQTTDRRESPAARTRPGCAVAAFSGPTGRREGARTERRVRKRRGGAAGEQDGRPGFEAMISFERSTDAQRDIHREGVAESPV